MFFAVQSYDIPSGLDKPDNSYQKTIYVSDTTQEKMRPTHGDRSYTFVAPALWNGLPARAIDQHMQKAQYKSLNYYYNCYKIIIIITIIIIIITIIIIIITITIIIYSVRM